MTKITAEGIRSGLPVMVTAYKKDRSPVQIEVNGEHSEEFNDLIQDPPAMAGTYYPDPGSMLATLAVLQGDYFDEEAKIEVEGDIGQVPSKPGRIY